MSSSLWEQEKFNIASVDTYKNPSNTPKSGKVLEIKDFSTLSKGDIENYISFRDSELDLKKKGADTCTSIWTKRGGIILTFLVIITYFILSILAICGFIENQSLTNSFQMAVGILISSVIGFALGLFYERSK